MDPISAIATTITIAELAYKGYQWIDNLQPAIEKAYNKALQQWCKKNPYIREQFAKKQFSTLPQLYDYILNKDANSTEIKSLSEIFESVLKENTLTYQSIIELLSRENLVVSGKILSCITDVKQDLSVGFRSEERRVGKECRL